MQYRISPQVLQKLRDKHGVSIQEVHECFNHRGRLFEDTRAGHATVPPTLWFVATTDRRRVLKIVVVAYFAVKTAYEPRDNSEALYAALCQRYA